MYCAVLSCAVLSSAVHMSAHTGLCNICSHQVEEFTKEQVVLIRKSLKSIDTTLADASQDASGTPVVPPGTKEQLEAIGAHFLQLEKYVNLNFTG